MLCICHSPNEDICYTGAQSGEIYVWQGSTYRKAIPAHKGAVYAMFALLQSDEKVKGVIFYQVFLYFSLHLQRSPTFKIYFIEVILYSCWSFAFLFV